MSIYINNFIEVQHADESWKPEFGDIVISEGWLRNPTINIQWVTPYDKEDNDPFELLCFYGYVISSIIDGLNTYENGPKPISSPRGLPDNVSPQLKTLDEQDDGNYDHSFVTLRELMEYNWDAHIYWIEYEHGQLRGEPRYTPIKNVYGVSAIFPTIENMKKLGYPERVRLVFWFDQ